MPTVPYMYDEEFEDDDYEYDDEDESEEDLEYALIRNLYLSSVVGRLSDDNFRKEVEQYMADRTDLRVVKWTQGFDGSYTGQLRVRSQRYGNMLVFFLWDLVPFQTLAEYLNLTVKIPKSSSSFLINKEKEEK